MKRRWAVGGVGLGIAAGVAVSATLGAFDTPGKQVDRARPVEVAADVQTGTATTDTRFVEIEPIRAFDSRIPTYVSSGIFAPGDSRRITIFDGHDATGAVVTPDAVPRDATAIAYNLTVTGPTGPNFLAVTPGLATGFTTSAINFNGTSDVANAAIVSIDFLRTVKVWNGDQSGSTHVIIDITGYFVKPLFAEVAADGTLTGGSRVVSVSRVAAGYYTVKFDRSVDTCAYAATIGDADAEEAGAIDVARQMSADSIDVFTQTNDGAPPSLEDRAFYLVVTC